MANTFFQVAFAAVLLLMSSCDLVAARMLRHQEFHYSKRATTLAISTNLTNGWSFSSCYTDSVNARTLTGSVYTSTTSMTQESCVSYCAGLGYGYAGTEYSGECYCGNSVASTGTVAALTDCNMACYGNTTEACGGSDRLTLFYNDGTTNPTGTVTGTGLWALVGCFNDSTSARTLTVSQGVPNGPSGMTVEQCTTACQGGGYSLAGLEYSQECYCGNAFSNGGTKVADSGCNMACSGNSSEICGGSNRLNVYDYNNQYPSSAIPGASSASSPSTSTTTSTTSKTSTTSTTPTTSKSSTTSTTSKTSTTSTTSKTSTTSTTSKTSTTSTTSKTSTTSTTSKTSTTSTTSKTSTTTSTPTTSKTSTTSTTSATSKTSTTSTTPTTSTTSKTSTTSTTSTTLTTSTSKNSTVLTTSTTSISSTSTSKTTTSTSATGSALPSGMPAGWTYSGCYIDQAYGRILLNEQPDSQTLTIQSCAQACFGMGYTVSGLEYSTQCFCDNFLRNGAALASSDSTCAMTCSGNSSQICGGPNLVSVYSNGPVQIYQPPAAQNTSLPGSWKYVGCLLDSSTGTRSLPYQLILTNNNTATNCLSQCSAYGYLQGGMEYGDECYCGDLADIQAANATLMPETDCNTACSGNASYICGAGNRISYYTWSGTPIYTWGYPTGNAAGVYEYLIDAPIVALITNAGINGKVTFIEKYGTSYSGNGTGAYELDLSLVNNYTAAWRTMHVETDVFCSAGLTLPDKAGRQINVGGWSDTSTYGIRLYIPDGSPGVPGVNDWQENPAELELQVGRWYPSAMIMSNGSILIVGGEAGSNGVAVPSLELLPNPNNIKPLFCDYLNRTDPYNLYPYLAVMPSGNIFISYYNEARLLDPVTLQTTKTLPNMPGSVNNFLAGRTYPLEGTAMLMPQKAPYTDLLTVMICGGSIPAPNAPIALDNCVSTQPDSTNANWTIERMPSKRVISCIAALPDGTYMIMNGGMEGTAGFALASEPNLNAVLYDPSKPVNQRMSVMANTTIDRLYHSEAILLQDGRVLVSGSDPEDSRFPQEFRVETFTPPYLLSGLAQPTFTISTTDWKYGSAYTFQLTSGSTANLKVSLLGAVSSTHGNSMGQRTIFPAVSCSGTTCTVTAPPNNKVCPPGWFQMFVLDGPTPSHSTWVRIGGDPALLGNWPSGFSDFTDPGVSNP